MKLVASMDGTSNVWAVGRFDALTKDVNLPQQAMTQIPPIEWLAFSAAVAENVSGRVYAETKDQQSGDQLRAVDQRRAGCREDDGRQQPEGDGGAQLLQATGAGKSVELAFTVSPELLDQLHGGIPGLSNAPNTPMPPRVTPPVRPSAAVH